MATRSEIRTEVEGRPLTLTNLEKVLYPEHGLTKGEVIDYYLQIAPTVLPHLKDRVLTRVRFPDGPAGFSFYEKNLPAGCPEWVTRRTVIGADETTNYLVADSTATLVYLANLAALELHTPQWHLPAGPADQPIILTDPDTTPPSTALVIDLDPGAGLPPQRLAYAAQLVGGLLATAGLTPHPKSSGNKGLQIYAAIAPTPGHLVTAYAKSLGEQLARREPTLFVATVTVAERTGKVFLDYNQNLTARNTIAPYSLRGRAFPGVSTPMTWDEVAAIRTPADFRFDPAAVLARVAEQGDLFTGLLDPHNRAELPSLQ